MAPKIWFVTGASSGLGRAVTKHVLSVGDIAVATCRKPPALDDLASKYDGSKLLVLKVDVSKKQDIVDAFAEVKKRLGRIDVVYSNAGYGILGEVEITPDDTAHALWNANYWGAVHVAQESVKFFREVNKPIGGRLLVASSIAAQSAMAGMAQYAATKYAIEGVHEGLQKELNPAWNIKINSIVIGSHSTRRIEPESLTTVPADPAYAEAPSARLRAYFGSGGGTAAGTAGDPDAAAKVLYQVSQDPDAPFRVGVGRADTIGALKARADAVAKEIEYYEKNYEKWAK